MSPNTTASTISSTTKAMQRERPNVYRFRRANVGIVALLGMYFMTQNVAVCLDMTQFPNVENMTISGKDDVDKIIALAKAIAAMDTHEPSLAPQSTASPTSLQALVPVVKQPAPAKPPTHWPKTGSLNRPSPFPVQVLQPLAWTSTNTTKPISSQSPTSGPTYVTTSPTWIQVSQSPSTTPSYSTKRPSVRPTVVQSHIPSVQLVPSSSPTSLKSDIPSLFPSITQINSTTISPAGSTSGSKNTSASSIMSCPKQSSTQQLIVLPYIYAMETDIHYDVSTVRLELEQILNLNLAPMLLDCTRRRYLLSMSGLVAIDWQPIDVPSTTLSCTPRNPDEVCNVFLGKMSLYVLNITNSVEDVVIAAIQNVFRIIVVAGLVKVTYLGADLQSASFALLGTNSTRSISPAVSNGSLGPSAVILFTTGSAALVAAMGIFWYIRQKRAANGVDPSGAATQAAGTDANSAEYYNEGRPTSPFSEMLPSAYRFDHDMNMSAILETDEESQARSELLVSEGWVSDNDTNCSMDVPSSSNYSRLTATPVLGARKRTELPAEPFELCSL